MYCTTYFIRINEYRCLKNLLLIDLFVTLYQRLIKSDEHYKLKYEMGMKVLSFRNESALIDATTFANSSSFFRQEISSKG